MMYSSIWASYLIVFTTLLYYSANPTYSLSPSKKQPQREESNDYNQCNNSIHNNRTDQPFAKDRISGGFRAKPGQFPSFISIHSTNYDDYYKDCSGVLISEDLILTAAHCILDNVESISAAPGIYGPDFWEEKGIHPRVVDRICISDKYNSDYDLYDLAVLRLERPLKLSNKVGVACLPEGRPMYSTDLGLTVGTGRSDIYHDEPLQVLPTRREKCSPSTRHKSNICLGPAEGYDGTICRGDSGGPTFVEVDGEQCVYGITSYSRTGCTRAGDLWVSANIHANIDHIKELIETCSNLS